MKRLVLSSLVFCAAVSFAETAERVFRDPVLSRGNLNIVRSQPVDDAKWLWDSGPGTGFVRFRNTFAVKEGDGPLVIDVSADERFYLTCDGRFVARGPNRGTVENWQYQTYRLDLAPGEHTLEAVVWRLGGDAPLAQRSLRPGFVLKASGAFDARLTTGRSPWRVGRLRNIVPAGADGGAWGTGCQVAVEGRGPYAAEPDAWEEPSVSRGEAGAVRVEHGWGLRSEGWLSYPSQIADQIERPCAPGRIVAALEGGVWRGTNVFDAASAASPAVAALNALLREGRPFVVPPRTRVQAAWNLGDYYCAYPLAVLSGGKGGRLAFCWTESSREAATGLKRDRNAIAGKYLEGYGDTFVCDGARGEFSSPWFRCGKWVRLDFEAGDEPLVVEKLSLVESRYPLEAESVFRSPDDPSLEEIRRISARAMQMCCHEMFFDCPFYEQQMYPGDTRVQLRVLAAMTRDARMIRRAIEMYDLAARDNGMCPMNWPTRMEQESASYTLCYLCMFGDYVMNHAPDRAWLRARLPGLRKAMAGIEFYENAEGLVENLPGWSFIDWAEGWRRDGTVDGARPGEGPSSILNLFWVMAMESAACVEETLGNGLQARYWREKAARLRTAIVDRFWVDGRSLLADSVRRNTFSEHAQALALLTDTLPADKARRAARALVSDPDLVRCTVYFSYYLFDAYFKIGRPDLFQERLALWRAYLAAGLSTPQEAPDKMRNGRFEEARSDCHAWGAHPLLFMQTGLAGIRSAAPGFARVRIAPQPGSLTSFSVRHPHPDGWIEADLSFDGARVRGVVRTPVPGAFVFGGEEIALEAGETKIDLGGEK